MVVASLLVLGLAELAVRGLDLFPQARAATRVGGGVAPAAGAPVSRLVPQPFRGWSLRPGSEGDALPEVFGSGGRTAWFEANRRVNRFGHQSSIEDYRQLAAADLVIGLFGGSVANDLAVIAGDELLAELARRRPQAGAAYLVNFAQGGYKQPQQLYALSEALLLGVPLDVAVNLDGYNELALGGQDAEGGFHPYFPRRTLWAAAVELSRDAPTLEQAEETLAVLRWRQRAARWRGVASRHAVLGRLELARALLGRAALAAEGRAAFAERRLGRRLSAGAKSLVNLPEPCLGGDAADCLPLLVELWADASRLMDAVAARRGVRYLHLLQPNQYVAGGKPLSDEERKTAVDAHHPWRPVVAAGYPLLRRRGAALAAEGIGFVDLTGVFADHPEPLYRDACCHLGLAGNRILARAVAARIAAVLPAGDGSAASPDVR